MSFLHMCAVRPHAATRPDKKDTSYLGLGSYDIKSMLGHACRGFDSRRCVIEWRGSGLAGQHERGGLAEVLQGTPIVELRHLEVLFARSAKPTFVAWHRVGVEGIMQRSWTQAWRRLNTTGWRRCMRSAGKG